ncbi:MAG: aldehyde dehydrogenase family protein [Myxococcales bacterium]|nr:aldehyde dehydrogenase family protein [Myxococcales bacterium]
MDAVRSQPPAGAEDPQHGEPPPLMIPCHEPATRALLGEVPVTPPAEVRAAIARARAAQREWARSSFAARRRVLQAISDALLADLDGVVARIVRDSGKTRENALMGELLPVCEKLRWTIRNGERHLRPERVRSGLLLHKRARVEFQPMGVVGAIIPWNYPLQNLLNPIIPALMAGNGVVVKPSEWVAWSAPAFVQLVKDAIAGEGFSPELVQCVQGYGETGEALVRGGVDCVLFIGSGRNGRRVLEAAAHNLVPVVLELGGKDPFIVCADAELEQAVHAALGGCFINCGQNCVASERVIVDRAVADAFERRVVELVAPMRQGLSTEDEIMDVGAMITPPQLELVERLVDQAVREGARLVIGGQRVQRERGDFYAPTVLADVTPEMTIMREEVFGPVMLLCPVDGDDEAIRVANATPFGLGASVMSRDRRRARRIARQLRSGMVAINDFGGLTYMAQDLPFGGVGASGFGRMNGRDGLRSFTNQRAVLDDRLPLHPVTAVYPVKERTYEQFKATLRLLYGRGLKARWHALRDALAAARARPRAAGDAAGGSRGRAAGGAA